MSALKPRKNSPALARPASPNSVKSDEHRPVRLWLRLLSCTHVIETQVRANLREQFDSTLPRFDLMAQLQREPEGLRMGELGKRMLVTGGNITSIVDQLETEGLVERKAVADDRRAFRIVLTKKGKQSFAVMAQTHEAWIEQLFTELSAKQQTQLHELLGQLKANVLHQVNPEDALHFEQSRHRASSASEIVSRRAA